MKKNVISFVAGIIAGAISGYTASSWKVKKKLREQLICEHEFAQKNDALFHLMSEWVKIYQQGRSIESFFVENHYKKIAIYGMGEIGQRLYDELEGSLIRVVFTIDARKDLMYKEAQSMSVEDNLPEVDAIVVTAIYYYDEIYEKLHEKVNCPILSLDDIVFEL